MTEIKLGQRCRDRITGFTGIATSKNEQFGGAPQYCLQPPKDEKESFIPDGKVIDSPQLVFVDDGVSDSTAPADGSVTLVVGVRAKDRVSGLSGILTEKVTFLNGCVYFVLTCEDAKNREGKPVTQFLPHKRYEKIDDGLLAIAAPEGRPAARRPAGPMRDALVRD